MQGPSQTHTQRWLGELGCPDLSALETGLPAPTIPTILDSVEARQVFLLGAIKDQLPRTNAAYTELARSLMQPRLDSSNGHAGDQVAAFNYALKMLLNGGRLPVADLPRVPEGALRPDYYHGDKSAAALAELGVFNVTNPSEIGQWNLNLRWPELSLLRKMAIDSLANDVAMLPFVNEPTAAINVAYAQSIIRSGIAISASNNEQAQPAIAGVKSVLNNNSKLINQTEILSCIDWQKVYSYAGITPNFQDGKIAPPKGNKGLTVLAGLIYLYQKRNGESSGFITFSDTDFLNPLGYDSIPYLGIPHALTPDANLQMVINAKTGKGRNNEGWTSIMNNIAGNFPTPNKFGDLARSVAAICSGIIWPLCGNRRVSVNNMFTMPYTPAMGLESMMNIHAAGLSFRDHRLNFAQVLNPNSFLECGVSTADREHAHVGYCGKFARAVFEIIQKTGHAPHEFSQGDIRSYNDSYGGQAVSGLFQNEYLAPNVAKTLTLEHILPSVETMFNLGFIDTNRLSEFL